MFEVLNRKFYYLYITSTRLESSTYASSYLLINMSMNELFLEWIEDVNLVILLTVIHLY